MNDGIALYGNLPLFPCFNDAPSADRLERVIERLMDRADASFLAGKATQAQYDAWTKALDRWSNDTPIAR